MSLAQLLETARSDDLERLRWQLCRMFFVAPWSKLGRALTEEACLALAAQVLLDKQAGPRIPEENPGFDRAVFERRKGAGT